MSRTYRKNLAYLLKGNGNYYNPTRFRRPLKGTLEWDDLPRDRALSFDHEYREILVPDVDNDRRYDKGPHYRQIFRRIDRARYAEKLRCGDEDCVIKSSYDPWDYT